MWLANRNTIPEPVLKLYGPIFQELNWVPVSGGFSGASVWRGDDAQGNPRFALKQWPAETAIARLAQIHGWMSDAAHLTFVPKLSSTTEGSAIAQHDERIWDATLWLTGDSRIPACKTEVESACAAVAEIHLAWSRYAGQSKSAGIQRRIDVLSQWLAKPSTRLSAFQASLDHLVQRAVNELGRIAPIALEALLPWENVPQIIQPCIRDLRAEHVLFVDERVSGIIDYGAMAVDTPVFDLARLLGDLVDDNEELFAQGLNAYRECRTTFVFSDRLVRLLDRVGVVCSLIGWLVRLSNELPSLPTENIAKRLLHLIVRAEQFKSMRSL
jgi:Ser/Thr protein kinase RdoA (MazF antagonist)